MGAERGAHEGQSTAGAAEVEGGAHAETGAEAALAASLALLVLHFHPGVRIPPECIHVQM